MYLFSYFSTSLRPFRRGVAALLLTFSLLLPLCACSGESRPENADQTISFHLQQDPVSLDPQIADSYGARIAVEALFEGLVRLDEDGKPYPGAAESWGVSSDGLTYTFHLREDAQWSKSIVTEDGETTVSSDPCPLTAQDFVYAWQRAVDPSTGCPDASGFACIKNAAAILQGSLSPSELGVSAVDDHTLVVQLESANEDFLSLTATTPFMPCQQDFFLWTSGRYGLEAKYICGNGPFAFSNSYAWDHEEKMTLRRSTSYSGENEPLPASLILYTSQEITDISNPLSAVEEEVVDLALLPSSQLEEAQSQEGVQVITQSMDAVWGLCFHTQDELLSHADIRKIFVQTLPRETLLENLPPHASAANDIIPEICLWNGKSYREQAGSNLFLQEDSQAISSLSSILSKLKLEEMPSITVIGPENTKDILNQMLITWNGSMGNYFNLEALSEEELSDRISSGEFQAAICALRTEDATPLGFLNLFASDSTDNPAHLQAENYDRLLEQAATGSLQALVEAETYLNQQAIFYPLYYTDRYYVANATLSGVVIHPAEQGIDFIQAGKLE